MRSSAKASWKYIGCSAHNVPSLSKTEMRSAGGTKSGPPCAVVRATKSTIPFLAAPSFHDGKGSAGADEVVGAAGVVARGGALHEDKTQQRTRTMAWRSLMTRCRTATLTPALVRRDLRVGRPFRSSPTERRPGSSRDARGTATFRGSRGPTSHSY